MDVIEDILSEEEVINMSLDVLAPFYKVLNTGMKDEISQYIANPKSNMEAVEKLSKCFGNDVTKSTFHLRVRENDSYTKIRSLRLQDLPIMAYAGDIDLDEIINYYDWLEKNEENLQADISGRNRDDFNEALTAMRNYFESSHVEHEYDIPLIMTAYKETLFCPTREKERSTCVKGYVQNKQRWKMQKRAAEYLKYCIDNGISLTVAREC